MVFKKKGVSPLIATVMLIGFTIAMATVVSTFIIKQTKETFNPENLIEDSSICDQMSLGVNVKEANLKIEKSTQTASNLYYIKGISIQNKGSYAVRGFVISPDSMKSEIQYNFDNRISKNIIKDDGDKMRDGLQGTDSVYYLSPAKMYGFGTKGIPIGEDITDTAKTKIKVYPVVFDPEKEKGVKCAKSLLVFDYREVCNGYGHTNTNNLCAKP